MGESAWWPDLGTTDPAPGAAPQQQAASANAGPSRWATGNGKALLSDQIQTQSSPWGDDVRDSGNTVDMPSFLETDTTMKLKR